MKSEYINMKRVFFSLLLFLFLLAGPSFAAQQAVKPVGQTASALDLRTKINAELSAIQSNFIELFSTTGNTLELLVQEPLSLNNETGVLSLQGGDGISYLGADPTSIGEGDVWYNYTDGVLRVAASDGIKNFAPGSTTAWDTTPESFSFTDVENATPETTYTSPAIMVAGINWPAAISVSGDASAKYSVNGGTATATAGTVEVGDTVSAVVTSSASASTAVNSTVTISGVSDAFSVTTAASEYTYIGWPTDGDGSEIGNSNSTYSVGTDAVIAQKWTATESGTASAIKVKLSSYSGTITYSGVTLYKDIEGVITLVGSGTAALSTNWSSYITLTAASGQSLDFESGDILYFGAAVSSSGSIGIARTTGTSKSGSYAGSLANFTEPPAAVTFATLPGSQFCVILRYE